MKSADAGEFGEVVARHRTAFYRAALRRSRTHEDAEDAVQDAMLSAYQHLPDFQGRAKLSSWMTRIVINAALGRLRQTGRRASESLDPDLAVADAGPTPEDACYQGERRAVLERMVRRLPPPWRSVVRLRNLEGLSTREAAHALGIPEATLKTRLHRAHLQLARWLSAPQAAHPA